MIRPILFSSIRKLFPPENFNTELCFYLKQRGILFLNRNGEITILYPGNNTSDKEDIKFYSTEFPIKELRNAVAIDWCKDDTIAVYTVDGKLTIFTLLLTILTNDDNKNNPNYIIELDIQMYHKIRPNRTAMKYSRRNDSFIFAENKKLSTSSATSLDLVCVNAVFQDEISSVIVSSTMEECEIVIVGLKSGEMFYNCRQEEKEWIMVPIPLQEANGGCVHLCALSIHPSIKNCAVFAAAWNTGLVCLYKLTTQPNLVVISEVIFRLKTPDTLMALDATSSFVTACAYTGMTYIFSIESNETNCIMVTNSYVFDSSLVFGVKAVRLFTTFQWLSRKPVEMLINDQDEIDAEECNVDEHEHSPDVVWTDDWQDSLLYVSSTGQTQAALAVNEHFKRLGPPLRRVNETLCTV